MPAFRSLVLAVALAVTLAGCTFAASNAAVVPASALDERDWTESPADDFEALRGAVVVHVRAYEPKPGFLGVRVPAGVHLATAPDVPAFDESKFVTQQVVRIVQAQGFAVGDSTEEAFTLADGRSVTSTVYRVEHEEGDARMRVVPMPCPDGKAFVAGVGWGVPGNGFEDAGALLGAVTCPSA